MQSSTRSSLLAAIFTGGVNISNRRKKGIEIEALDYPASADEYVSVFKPICRATSPTTNVKHIPNIYQLP